MVAIPAAFIVRTVLEREMFILVHLERVQKRKMDHLCSIQMCCLLKMMFTPHVRSHTARQDHGRSESILCRPSKSTPSYFNANIDNNYSL